MVKLFVALTTRNKIPPPQKKGSGRLKQSEVFFSFADHVVANHVVPPGIWPGLTGIQNRPGFDRAIIISDSVEDDNIVCIDNFGFSSEGYGITHIKDCLDL